MVVARKLGTLEAFLRIPESKPALEFEDGRIIQKVSPKGRHSRLQVKLCEHINRFGEPDRVALAFSELRTTFAGHSYVPDVVVYRWERVPTTSDGDLADDFRVPPDVAVEIVSPEQSVNAQVRRCLWYVANGVDTAFLVDPVDRSVLSFRIEQSPKLLRGTDQIVLGAVLPDFRLTVTELFESLQFRDVSKRDRE